MAKSLGAAAGHWETYGQRPDGVDSQLVSLIVAHLCGCVMERRGVWEEEAEEDWSWSNVRQSFSNDVKQPPHSEPSSASDRLTLTSQLSAATTAVK